MTEKRRVLLVDDEPLAREGLRLLLESHADFELSRECTNGADAVQALRTENFDLVLLDIEMPELNGFDVLENVGVAQMPAVVFVTAFDQYAVKAFEEHALDYVVKPVEPRRFAQSLERVRKSIDSKASEARLAALLNELGSQSQQPSRIAARTGGRTLLVPVEDIDWLQSADNYVRLHCGDRVVLQRETLTHLVKRLNPTQFVRIHRSHAVNLSRVREVQSTMRGDAQVMLESGTTLTVSRKFRADLERALG